MVMIEVSDFARKELEWVMKKNPSLNSYDLALRAILARVAALETNVEDSKRLLK